MSSGERARRGLSTTASCALALGITVAIIAAVLTLALRGPRKIEYVPAAARELAAAIEAHAREHGAAPAKLDGVVGDYAGFGHVVEPGHGLNGTYGGFGIEYEPPGAFANHVELAWYHLGEHTAGAECSCAAEYVRRDEAPAALCFEIRADGRVRTVLAPPSGSPWRTGAPFVAEKFRAAPRERAAMLDATRAALRPTDRRFAEIESALGPPDGRVVLVDTPWQLRVVERTPGWSRTRIFVFRPSGQYPDRFHDGTRLERAYPDTWAAWILGGS